MMQIRFATACLGALLLAVSAAAGLLRAVESVHPPTTLGKEAPWVPSAGAVRVLSLGYHTLAADLFWIRAVQYFGGHIQTDRQYPHLYRLVDLTTSLDPHFLEAYQLGGLFLSLGRAFPEAIAIYRKGIDHNPDRWELPYDLGRMYFLDLGDNATALQWFERANTLPGRAHYLPRMVARLRARVGLIEAAIEMWERMLETTDNEWIRQTAAQEIQKLRTRQREGVPSLAPAAAKAERSM
jgi:tetratricopeptide (TPR) repeat protein